MGGDSASGVGAAEFDDVAAPSATLSHTKSNGSSVARRTAPTHLDLHLQHNASAAAVKMHGALVNTADSFVKSKAWGQAKLDVLLSQSGIPRDKPHWFCIPVRSKSHATALYVATLFGALMVYGAVLVSLEAPLEASENAEFTSLIAQVKAQVSPEVYEQLVGKGYLVRDPVRGWERFTAYDESTGNWTGLSSYTFGQAYYFAFITATTIGYGDITPRTTGGKWLTVVMILSMVPVAALTYTRAADWLTNGLMKLLLRGSRKVTAVRQKYDVGGDGILDKHELQNALRHLGRKMSLEEAEAVLILFDRDEDGGLDDREFAAAANVLNIPVGKESRNILRLQFSMLALAISFSLFVLISAYVIQLSAVDAVYFSLVTLTTIGYGDITPPPKDRAWFTLLIFVCLGNVAVVISSVAEVLGENHGAADGEEPCDDPEGEAGAAAR
jgi:hypothetical protein